VPKTSTRPRRHHLDFVEVFLVCGVLLSAILVMAVHYTTRLLVAGALAADGAAELRDFERAYGPHRESRYGEEWIIRDFFHDRRNGTFVDVGANDYRKENNTYYLETVLGWNGIAIDAQQEFAAGYEQHRPRTKFFALFVSDVSDATAQLYVPKANTLTASSNREFAEGEDGATAARKVRTTTLDDLLTREHVDRVDFVSMDIELAEPKALAGFDIERFRPALVCVEAHRASRQAILDYFQQHRYVVVGRYLRADTANLYFMPASQGLEPDAQKKAEGR
jgi:FkbM family methyltransferase